MDTIHIRTATQEDAHAIAVIHVKTWQCAYRGQLPDEYLDGLSVEKREAMWKKSLSDSASKITLFVAVLDNKIIGFCNVGPQRDQDLSADVGELYAVYIDPDFQGKGAGTLLMKKGLETLKGERYAKASLWVLTTNEKTKAFYERKGWRLEGKTKVEKRPQGELKEIRYIIDL